MIKRYGLGPKKLGGTADTSVYGPDIVEMKGGDYVRYEDYMRIIESIGAGGVKGRLMRKELSDEAVEEIKAMADIRLVNGRAELANVREIAHAITREVTRARHEIYVTYLPASTTTASPAAGFILTIGN